ncbi:MAG: BspA family leucine-rich repeat surface protein [Pseudomonadota bacterium]
MKKITIFVFFILCTFTLSAQTEDFEDEITNATSFTLNGLIFTTTGDLLIGEFNDFSCDGNAGINKYLDSGYIDGISSGVIGSILAPDNHSFEVSTSQAQCGWPGANDGNDFTTGTIRFSGRTINNTIIFEDFLLTSTNVTNLIPFTFSNSIWQGEKLTSLELEIIGDNSTMEYWAMDNLNFESIEPLTDRPFITTWQTTSDNESITIPTFGSNYNYNVNWGDGTSSTALTGNTSHTYTLQGTYDVEITGVFPRIYFLGIPDEERDKIIDVKQWGNNPWTSMEFAFVRCSNLQVSATDAPNFSNTTSLNSMFFEASTFNQSINHWDVSNTTNMREVFMRAMSFNQPLDNWQVDNVTDMTRMFSNALSFNQPLNTWDVSNVVRMGQLFEDASSFDQPLDNWNTSNVTRMIDMFQDASSFNQNIENWDVSNVTDMRRMFNNATMFNQSLDSWDVGNVTLMTSMFDNTDLSIENYDAILQGWSALPILQNNVVFGANNTNYCNGETARQILIDTYNWNITDAGLDCETLSLNDESLKRMSLYPNPATEYISVSNPNVEENFVIYNTLGQKVDSGQLLPESQISVNHLEKGVYFLKLDNLQTLRFVKQ